MRTNKREIIEDNSILTCFPRQWPYYCMNKRTMNVLKIFDLSKFQDYVDFIQFPETTDVMTDEIMIDDFITFFVAGR